MVTVMGVDARRGGWAVAVVDGAADEARILDFGVVIGQDDTAPLWELARRQDVRVIGADVPIGLPQCRWRPADLLAKRRLGRFSARVFLMPPRAVLREPDYASARARCRQLMNGSGLSAQTWGIRVPVLALDAALCRDSARHDDWARRHVVEVHPELAFAQLAGTVLPSKITAPGRQARLNALSRWLPALGGSQVPEGDDHLDALACAYSAMRWHAGAADVLGGDLDQEGLPQRIVI